MMCRIYEDPRRLTPEQQDVLKRHLIELAQDARRQAFRRSAERVLSWSGAAVRGAWTAARLLGDRALSAVQALWSDYRLWRERNAAIRALGALDDRMLK